MQRISHKEADTEKYLKVGIYVTSSFMTQRTKKYQENRRDEKMTELGRFLFGIAGICYLIISVYFNFKDWCDSKDGIDFLAGFFLTATSGAGLIYILNTL